jgi:hypothetical protein
MVRLGRSGLVLKPQSLTCRLGLAALLGAAVAFAGGHPSALILLFALVTALSVLALGWGALIGLTVGATFVTRFRFSVAGTHFMLEHFLLVACVLVLVARGQVAALIDAARHRAVVLFGGYVVWSAFISVVRAPSPAKSLPIVGWLGLDWLLVVVIVVAAANDPQGFVRKGARWLGPTAGVAVGLWVAANVFHTTFGVQTDLEYRGLLAAYGLSWEANVLASTLAVWVFLGLTDLQARTPRSQRVALGVASLAILLSLTRAGILALGAGFGAWAVLGGQVARRRVATMALVAAVGVLGFYFFIPRLAHPVAARASTLLDFRSGTGQYRATVAAIAIGDLHGLAWVTGLGTNSFGQRHLDPSLVDKPTPGYLGILPLQVVYDSGLVGAVLLGAAALTLIPKNPRRAARSVGVLVVYVACGSATSPLWFGFTWILFGVAVAARRQRGAAGENSHNDLLPLAARASRHLSRSSAG